MRRVKTTIGGIFYIFPTVYSFQNIFSMKHLWSYFLAEDPQMLLFDDLLSIKEVEVFEAKIKSGIFWPTRAKKFDTYWQETNTWAKLLHKNFFFFAKKRLIFNFELRKSSNKTCFFSLVYSLLCSAKTFHIKATIKKEPNKNS